jgi:predicted N-formylglutamate amidohydrolase
MNYLKVKDKDYLVRDLNSNAIINLNENEYEKYVENYKTLYGHTQKIKNLENGMNEIKNDLSEIKNLLINLKK